MSRAMLSEPAILVADEPTQGVDVGARAEIYRILREVSAARSAGRRRVERRDRAGGAVRPGDRDVARPRRRDARGRRRDRGADRPRRDQRDRSHRRAAGAAARTGSSRFARFIEGDYAPVVVLAAVMIALGAYVLVAERPLLLGLQHHLGHVRVRGARLHLAGSDVRAAARRHRPLRRAARRLPRRRRVVLRPRRSSRPGCGRSGSPRCSAARSRVGLVNGSLIRFAKFTPVAATLVTYIALGGLAFTLARRARRVHRRLGDRSHLHEGRPGAGRVRRLRRLRARPRARAPQGAVRPPAARGRVGRGVGAAGRRARQQDRAPRLRRRLAPHVPRRGRPARPARRRRPRPGHRIHADLDHRRRPRRHEPARRARHVHRHAHGRRPQRPGPQRDDVPQPRPEVAVHLPGPPDRRRGHHLQPGAPRARHVQGNA